MCNRLCGNDLGITVNDAAMGIGVEEPHIVFLVLELVESLCFSLFKNKKEKKNKQVNPCQGW